MWLPPDRKLRPLLVAISLLGSAFCLPKAHAIVTFSFQYADPAGQGFNDPNHPEYKAALVSAGKVMGSYFAHTATVTMSVTSTNDPNSATLASAGSDILSADGSNGFFPTVVQAKVISNGANDLNGAAADGYVTVNLGSSFQYDPNGVIGAGQIDFQGTLIHELTHAFGFISYIPQSPDTQPELYSIFDAHLTDASGNPLISPSTFAFNMAELFTLTGGNKTLMATPSPTGEYFDGPSSRANFGGKPIPIYSPNPYQDGSSGSHIDDNTQATNGDLMNAAAETSDMAGAMMTRVYSAAEQGIMTDLGFALAALHPAFCAGEIALSNGVYYQSFAGGTYFGYYAYLSNPRYFYHFDLGYEYWFNANDGKNGVYLYDFKSKHFLYSSPTFPFPYLYDFSLQSVLYYYPDTTNPGHYNTNGIRYFYDFASGKIISM